MFETAEELDAKFVYNDFCGSNLSKYLVKESRKEGKVLVFLKPCDTYSFNQLIKEHRIARENIYVIGVPCEGKTDGETLKALGLKGILGMKDEGDNFTVETLYGEKTLSKREALPERCRSCKSHKHMVYDELLGEEGEVLDTHRFDMVEKARKHDADERFAFWQGELSRCIRCNACRNVCPACTCEKCVFDNDNSGIAQKAAADSFEEKHVPHHPRLPRGGPLHGLRRVLPSVSAEHSAASAEPQVHQGYQYVLRRISRRARTPRAAHR